MAHKPCATNAALALFSPAGLRVPQPPRQRCIVDVLRERGLLDAVTNEAALRAAAAAGPLRAYCGFDPTAPSLHLGNLLGIIVLAWFQRCGHTPVALVGGAPGRVGDPSGKARPPPLRFPHPERALTARLLPPQSTERPVMDEATLEANVAGIGALLSALLPTGDAGLAAPLVLNNMAWFGGMTLLDFLRDVGKHARVGVMLSKDSVKARMGTPGAEGEAGEGMSYTEFTYQLLQAWVPARSAACAPAEPAAPADAPPRPPLVAFATATTFHICSRSTAYRSRHAGSARGRGSARLTWRPAPQIGGSDQWGNITAGTDLIRRVQQREGAIGAAAAPGLHACVPGLMGTS